MFKKRKNKLNTTQNFKTTKMKKTLRRILLIVFLIVANYSFGQNTALAQGYYLKAKEAFGQNDYTQSINFIEKAKIEAGGANPELLYLEIRSRYEADKKDPLIAERATEFMSTVNENDKKRIREISLITIEHKEAVELAARTQEEAYQKALTSGDVVVIRAFLAEYPSNLKKDVLENLLVAKEDEIYHIAIQSDEIDRYDNYLMLFPAGKYKEEVLQKLAIANEKKLYESVVSSRDVKVGQNYLSKYPNGKYKTEVYDLLEEVLFAEGNQFLEENNLSSARSKYMTYKEMFPKGKNIDTVEKNIVLIDKKANRQNAISSRTSANYFALTYSTNESYGFEFGKLDLKKLSVYWDLAANGNVFTALQATNDPIEVESLKDLPEDVKNGFLTTSFGFTFKVAYPVWIYVGGGLKYQQYYIKDGEGEIQTYKVNEEKDLSFYPEGGLKVKIGKAIVLKGGAQYVNDEIQYQFGIGIQTRNY